MSYQGGLSYDPVQSVDEVAEYTDMMGAASLANHTNANKGAWRADPTKNLVVLWFVALALYWLLGYFFRRYLR